MSEDKIPAQSAAQAGSSGEAANVGSAVGVLRSSDETPVMGSRAKAGYLFGCQRRMRPTAPQGDTLLRREAFNPDYSHCGKRGDRTKLGKPDTGNPFVRFDEERSGSAELTTTVSLIRLLPLRLLYPSSGYLAPDNRLSKFSSTASGVISARQ